MLLLSYENLIDPILKNVRQIIPGFADMKSGSSALDVCCGTGAQVIEYGKYGILATGIDKEQSMLNVALRNKEKLKLVNIDFHLADSTALPFNDGSFDYVSISFALHDKEREVINRVVSEMKRTTGLKKVVLSGGTFQNRYLLGSIEKRLSKAGFRVYSQNKIPANDGGIALGQLAIAAKRRTLGMI